MKLEDPKAKLGALQDIQWEIARIFDGYWAMSDYDKSLVQMLKCAFTDLNDAKGVILDIALDEGTMYRFDPGELPKD